jgi:putative hemolysin
VQIGITGILLVYEYNDRCANICCWFCNIKPYAATIAVGVVVVVFDFSLVLGSYYQKTKPSEAIAKKAMPMKFVSIVTAPFIWLLTHSTEFY